MANKKSENQQKQGAPKSVQRGTNNDLEILTLILEEHTGLRMRVLQRIREMRNIQQAINNMGQKPPEEKEES